LAAQLSRPSGCALLAYDDGLNPTTLFFTDHDNGHVLAYYPANDTLAVGARMQSTARQGGGDISALHETVHCSLLFLRLVQLLHILPVHALGMNSV
jgi:hypothetical protein